MPFLLHSFPYRQVDVSEGYVNTVLSALMTISDTLFVCAIRLSQVFIYNSIPVCASCTTKWLDSYNVYFCHPFIYLNVSNSFRLRLDASHPFICVFLCLLIKPISLFLICTIWCICLHQLIYWEWVATLYIPYNVIAIRCVPWLMICLAWHVKLCITRDAHFHSSLILNSYIIFT